MGLALLDRRDDVILDHGDNMVLGEWEYMVFDRRDDVILDYWDNMVLGHWKYVVLEQREGMVLDQGEKMDHSNSLKRLSRSRSRVPGSGFVLRWGWATLLDVRFD